MRECVASNNYGKGLWVDESVYDTKLLSCNFNANEQRGVVIELCGKLTVVNSLFCDNGFDGLVVFNVSQANDIWNCTFSGNGRLAPSDSRFTSARNLTFYSDNRIPMASNSVGRDTRYPFPDPDGMNWVVTNATVKNNIIAKINPSGQGLLAAEDYNRPTGTSRSWTQWGFNWDGNFYNWVTKPKYPWIYPNAGSASVTVLHDVGNVRTTLGQDANSTQVAGADALTADFQLLPAHEGAHAKATAMPAAIAALVGKPANTKYVGAWR
jgi:hypothetical protein